MVSSLQVEVDFVVNVIYKYIIKKKDRILENTFIKYLYIKKKKQI